MTEAPKGQGQNKQNVLKTITVANSGKIVGTNYHLAKES
jgi:hypothetical protein